MQVRDLMQFLCNRFAKSCQIPTATLTVPTDRKNMRKFQDKKFGYKSENNGKMEVQAFEGCPLVCAVAVGISSRCLKILF